MKYYDIKEGVGRITKQNQTVDVGPNEISIQAAKFGNKVDKDGRPANMKKKVKGSKTNVLFNLGMTESVDNLYESVLYYRQMKENLGEIAQATEIYVDMDGVLADFFGEWAKLMKVDHFSKIDKEHKIGDALQAIRDKDEFWLNLPLLPQAKQLLSVIKQIKGEYNICSSPLADDPNSEPHKREWIKNNLAFFPPKEVIITSNKPEYATQQDGTPNILIDDYGVNVDAWEAAGGTAFKYKDHKFERTANAIKQHMQEPVEESIILEHPAVIAALYAAGTTVRELVKRYGLKSVRQALDKLKNQRANTQKPANDHGGPIDNIIAAVKKPRTSDEIARFQQQNLPRALDNAKAMIRHTSKDFKAGKLSREEFNKIMRYARHKFKNQTGKDLPIDDLLKLTEQETNKKTRDAATQKAKPYDLPIRKDIADLIIQSYPELQKIWVTSDRYGIVGIKLKNGPLVTKLQRQLKKDGYPIKVDGNAGNKTDKMLKHWLGNVIYYLKHDYLGESVTEGEIIRGKTANRDVGYDPNYKGLQNYDGKHLMNDADAIEAMLYGRTFSQREDAFRDLLIRKYKITRETDIGALLKSIRDQLEAKNRQHIKDRDADNAQYDDEGNFIGDGKEKVQEAFDNPYPITWEYLKPTGASSAIGKVDDGSALDIHISEDPAGIYEIEFARGQSNKNMGRTGQGDEFRIFATVQAAMLEWWEQLDKTSARKITFYANKEDGNRSRLYKRFLKMWGDKSEWDIEVNANVKPGLVAYTLTNPTPDEPENAAKTLLQRLFGKKKTVENFADGKVKGKSKPGRVKKSGASCNGSVTELRKKAKNASGERAKMYHWCANMKSGRS